MNYEVWSKQIKDKLLMSGISEFVEKAFTDADSAIHSAYEKGELTQAGAAFVVALEKYDLDLKISAYRLNGNLKAAIEEKFKISREDVNTHLSHGWIKKVAILGWFRGDEVPTLPFGS